MKRFRVIDAPQRNIAKGCDRVLEIGCGTGRLLAQADARTKMGVDLSAGLLRTAMPRVTSVMQADAHHLPFAAQNFDAILAGNGVFRYLDYDRAFAECHRVLRPGGRLAVHQYAARPLSLRHPLRSSHESHPTHVDHLDQLRVPATRAGFVEEELFLWRGLPVYPYVVRIPEVVAWRWWHHMTLIVRRR